MINSIQPNSSIAPFILEVKPTGNKCNLCSSYDTHDDNRIIRIGSRKYTKIYCKPCGNQFYKQL